MSRYGKPSPFDRAWYLAAGMSTVVALYEKSWWSGAKIFGVVLLAAWVTGSTSDWLDDKRDAWLQRRFPVRRKAS